MTARTERPEGGGRIAVIKCPLCDFQHIEVMAPISNGTLASVFGRGVMAAVAEANYCEKIEAALRAHLSSHSLEEWVKAVTDRDTRIHELCDGIEGRRV